MNEHELSNRQYKGSRAEELLKSEVFNECFDQLQTDYIAAWRSTAAKDTEAREKLWIAVGVLGKVKDHLVKLARDGRVATKDLASIKYLKR